MLTRPIKSCNQTPRHSRNKYIYYRQGTVKVRKYHKDQAPNKNIQHKLDLPKIVAIKI